MRAQVAAVPGCALASDQPYREADLAIDYCEDVPPLPLERPSASWRSCASAGPPRQGELDPRQRLVRRLRQAGDERALFAEQFGIDLDREQRARRLCRRLAERRADVRFLPQLGRRGERPALRRPHARRAGIRTPGALRRGLRRAGRAPAATRDGVARLPGDRRAGRLCRRPARHRRRRGDGAAARFVFTARPAARASPAPRARHRPRRDGLHFGFEHARAPRPRRGRLADRPRHAPGMLAGSFGAALVAGFIPTRPLAIGFTALVFYAGHPDLFDLRPPASRELPGAAGLFLPAR